MKNDLPYFSHDNDARNHAKMKALRGKYSWNGYGLFWALNEMVAEANEVSLDLSRKIVRGAVACELNMTTQELEKFLMFLADPEECGLITYKNGIVKTDRTTENYQKLCIERDRKKKVLKTGAEKRWKSQEKEQNGAENQPNGAEKEPNGMLKETKVKESKVKEIKGKETEENPSLSDAEIQALSDINKKLGLTIPIPGQVAV